MLNIVYSRWVTDLHHVEMVIVDYRRRQEQKKNYKKWVANINQRYRKPKRVASVHPGLLATNENTKKLT